MPTGLDVVARALWIINTYHPTYNNTIGVLRCRPDLWPHQCDCSGLICAVARDLGVGVGCQSSAWFAQVGHQQGLTVTLPYALQHAGHLLIRGPREGQDGYGNLGHIGISVGNGTAAWWGNSVEARGTRAGVGVFEADDIWWSYAMRMPRITYTSVAPTPPAVKPKPKPVEEGEVFWLPGQKNDNFTPIGVQVLGGVLYVYNVTINPFNEGSLLAVPNGHKLRLALQEGEEILGCTDRRPDGTWCPPNAPIEVCTNLPPRPDNRGQPRHILTRRAA